MASFPRAFANSSQNTALGFTVPRSSHLLRKATGFVRIKNIVRDRLNWMSEKRSNEVFIMYLWHYLIDNCCLESLFTAKNCWNSFTLVSRIIQFIFLSYFIHKVRMLITYGVKNSNRWHFFIFLLPVTRRAKCYFEGVKEQQALNETTYPTHEHFSCCKRKK